MKKWVLISGCILTTSCCIWAEPGGTYTLTGKEKGIEEIIKADMAQYPELYRGVNLRNYISSFKKKNNVGKRKFSPGEVLYFPETDASLSAKKEGAEQQEEKTEEADELPSNFKLRDLPEVVQEGSYCVPACGEWIAKFHGIKTDQQEIAKLSSQGSMDNSGTNPLDMARAMENFGFQFRPIINQHTAGDVEGFTEKTLPLFKDALVHDGPMYISFKPGIFGANGHGCVVIGYSDTRKEMYFYNPWGQEFSEPYREVEKYTRTAIAFTPPKHLGDENVDCTLLIKSLHQAIPNSSQNFMTLQVALQIVGISFKYVECNRSDLMDDAKKTERLALRESQKFIDLAMERVPAILIPQTDDESTTSYVLIRKSPESKGKLLIQRIDACGWGDEELSSSKQLIRNWTTPITTNGKKLWMLPMFEFSGTVTPMRVETR
ncbi:MAG: C39 family peptidase [Pontiellaceae bacterium]|nr:C39 family peptidase [Pontiellaceae bacterium]MBN2786097.1 C39 family peptidase [Pontiellaceae bacterium]